MRQDFWAVHRVELVEKFDHLSTHILIILKRDSAMLETETLIKQNSLADVEGVVDRQTGLVELMQDFHAGAHVVPVEGFGVACAIVIS